MYVFNVTIFQVLWTTTFKRQFIYFEKLFSGTTLDKRILKPCHIYQEVLCDSSWLSSAVNCCQKELRVRFCLILGSSLSANNSPVQFFKGFMFIFILLRENYVFDSSERYASERCIKFMPWKIMLFWDCWFFLCEAVLLYSVLSIWYLLISCLAQWR